MAERNQRLHQAVFAAQTLGAVYFLYFYTFYVSVFKTYVAFDSLGYLDFLHGST